MEQIGLTELGKILQTSISPVAMISGVGLLLLSMTNRLGRTIDRARILSAEIERNPNADNYREVTQIKIIFRRGRNLRMAITCACLSILFASLIIAALFLTHLMSFPLRSTVMAFFIACLAFLLISLILFLKDIALSLHAVKLEVGKYL